MNRTALMGRLILLAAGTPAPLAQAQMSHLDSAAVRPGEHRQWVSVGGLRREYVVFVPGSYRGLAPIPVVLMFHGSGGTIEWDLKATGWEELAERKGFLAVFPNGFPDENGMRVWNDGRFSDPGGVDDVAFVRAMLEDLGRQFRVDRNRVFVTGFSNGAGLSFRLATELNNRIAAIAPVAGRGRLEQTPLRRPVPTLFIIGTADGGFAARVDSTAQGVARRVSAAEFVSRWAGLAGCPPTAETLPAEGRVSGQKYGPCPKGSEVRFYAIDGWEHYWPGGRAPGFELWAESAIWEFFQKHPLR